MKHFLLITAICLCTLSVSAQTGSALYTLQDKIDRIEHDLILVQQRVYKGKMPQEGTPAVSGEQADELLNKIMAQESALNDLTQNIEQLTHDINQVREQVKKLNADIDVRFKLLENEKEQTQPDTPKNDTPPVMAKKTPQEQYDSAYTLLKQGNHVAAEQAFIQFIKDHPKHNLAGNANYWLGETYYARGQYEQAAPIFAEGFTTYKNNSKAPDNLLKLGLTMHKLGKKNEACTAFTSLADEFPKADKNILTRAKDEAEKLTCPK